MESPFGRFLIILSDVKRRLLGFTLVELMITMAVFAVLVALARPQYIRYRARSAQAEARLELSQIYGIEAPFREQFKTYHMNFMRMGYVLTRAIPTDVSSNTNPYSRSYALSAGGPVNPAIDDPKPVSFGSLELTVPDADPTGYTGWIAPNGTQCNISAAQTYGATGGATPTATATTLLAVAKGCPMESTTTDYDVWTINESGIIQQTNDGID